MLKAISIPSSAENNTSGIAMSCLNIGDIFKTKGDIDKALMYFNKGLNAQQSLADTLPQAEFYMAIGEIYGRKNEINLMKSQYIKSEEIFARYHNKYGLINLYLRYGDYHLFVPKYDEALKYFTKAKQLAENGGYKKNIATAQTKIGLVLIINWHMNTTRNTEDIMTQYKVTRKTRKS